LVPLRRERKIKMPTKQVPCSSSFQNFSQALLFYYYGSPPPSPPTPPLPWGCPQVGNKLEVKLLINQQTILASERMVRRTTLHTSSPVTLWLSLTGIAATRKLICPGILHPKSQNFHWLYQVSQAL